MSVQLNNLLSTLGMARGLWTCRRALTQEIVGGAGCPSGAHGVHRQLLDGKYEKYSKPHAEDLRKQFAGNPYPNRILRLGGILRQGQMSQNQMQEVLDVLFKDNKDGEPPLISPLGQRHFPTTVADIKCCMTEIVPTLIPGVFLHP